MILLLALLIGVVFSTYTGKLRFREDGTFKIVQVKD